MLMAMSVSVGSGTAHDATGACASVSQQRTMDWALVAVSTHSRAGWVASEASPWMTSSPTAARQMVPSGGSSS